MTRKKFRHYLTIEFPESFSEEHIKRLQQYIQEIMFDVGNRECVVKKVDYTTSSGYANVPPSS